MPGGESESSSRTESSGLLMVSLDVGSLAAFDTKGDPHGLSQRWRKWKRSFKLYLPGKGVTDDAQKRALLLHAAGVDVQEIYFTLVSEDEITTLEATMKVLDDYFIPKANVPFERHLFRQIAQEMGETVDQFICRLANARLAVISGITRTTIFAIKSSTSVIRVLSLASFWKRRKQ